MSDSAEVIKTSNKLTIATAIFCALLFFLSISTVGYVLYGRESTQRDVNAAVCKAVIRLDNAITSSLRRSLIDTPKLAYYKDHPDELADQIAQIRRTIKQFVPPPECGNIGGNGP